MRYALYFTPGQNDPLSRIAASWLGRDPFTGAQPHAQAAGTLSAAEIAFHTAAPRRYGFHATLKAPFHLAPSETEASLDSAVAAFAENVEPVVIPQLVVKQIDGFLALVPAAPLPALNRFADDVVREFDRFRAPLGDAEISRRNPDALSPQQVGNLHRWGYPYVFESFRFHMTLTGRVAAGDLARVRAAVDETFGPVLDRPAAVDGLAVFVEPEPGAPFMVRSWHALGRRQDRKTA